MSDLPLNILMVAPTSFFADYGCHVRILEETRVLQALGHRVTIVTYQKGRDLPDVTIYRTPRLPWHADYEVGSSRHKFAYDAYLGPTVLRHALQDRPAIVHGHLHEGALIGYPTARLLGAPLVFDFQGSMTSEMLDHGFIRRDTAAYRLAAWGEDRINRLPDAVITSSVRGAWQYATATPGRAAQPIPDTVNPHVFKPDLLSPQQRAAERAALGIPPDSEVIVYLGLLAPYQGTDHLLQAVARLHARRPGVHLLLMGYPNLERYHHLALQLGLEGRVTLTGRVPYEDAPRRLALGDIAVAPKLSDTEGAGKLLNYMAMGLPSVAFDTPVSREYLGDWGLYAAPGSVESLAQALAYALDDPRRAERATCLRKHVVARFPWEGMGRSLVAVYEKALLGRRTTDGRRPTTDDRRRTMDDGGRTTDGRRPMVDYGGGTVDDEGVIMVEDNARSSVVGRPSLREASHSSAGKERP